MADVIELGARVLRRLGVAPVADIEAPPLSVTVTPADIAGRALQTLGITVPASDRPETYITTSSLVAARAVQMLGIVVPAGDRPSITATVTVTELAARALQGLDIPVPASAWQVQGNVVTVPNIALDALMRLGVIASDEAPSGTDQAQAEVAVFAVHENLVQRGLTSWGSSTIPRAAAQDYALLTALQLATTFGKQGDPNQRSGLEGRIGWVGLLLRAQALAEARMNAIHAGLVAAGLMAYPANAIPASVAEPYVALLQIDLAPVFGKQSDPSRAQQYEMQIRRDALTRRAQDDAAGIVATVHDRLVAMGIADWTTGTIPVGLVEEYAELVANNYRPLFGAPVDRSGEPAIEQRIRRLSLVLRGQSLAEGRVAVVHDALVSQGSASWTVDAIPQAVADEYAGLVAQSLLPSFGGQTDIKAVVMYEERVKRAALLARGPMLAEEAIEAVHHDLAARGKARWTLQDIPAAAERPYVMLAAYHLAPTFDRPQNQGDVIMATVDLNRIIALPTSGERTRVEYF